MALAKIVAGRPAADAASTEADNTIAVKLNDEDTALLRQIAAEFGLAKRPGRYLSDQVRDWLRTPGLLESIREANGQQQLMTG
ncbi:hypothetical protein M707_21985 [Arthrobacter sp. AK-YN10]|nr:hypothetical protein M707_21985 [Arthrobacter sp. AK-YN10]